MAQSLEDIKNLMDTYGDFRHRLEGEKSEMKRLIDKVMERDLSIADEIESIRYEFEEKIKRLEEQEKVMKKNLSYIIIRYSSDTQLSDKEKFTSKLVNAFSTRKIEYDSVQVDIFIKQHIGEFPALKELLDYRKDKYETRITLQGL